MVGGPGGRWTGPVPPDQWLTQTLDHFNDADTRTWQQRYFLNDTFYKPGGPVFLMIGGEGTAQPTWMVMGQWIKYAEKYRALCLMLEHRYYGKSHPTEDTSTENLAYLSSEQALADLAFFRSHMTQKLHLEKAKWIAFGGSYPGFLAAVFRMKYPHLVDGSVATSAPVHAQLNFQDYIAVVRDSLATTGSSCNSAIGNATAKIESLLQSSQGRAQLKNKFRLCDDIDLSNKNDIANLFANLAGNFENVVQYNKDNRAFEGAIGTNITIDVLCAIMSDTSKGSSMDRYAAVNSLILDTYSQSCQDFKYSNLVQNMRKTAWTSSASEGGRQWTYQTCTEFGYYQSSDLDDQPFGHSFPLSFWVQQCADIFGDKFKQSVIEKGINRTNIDYGGYGMKVTKVVFPNGSIDPWHALGFTKDISPDATAIFIKGTAHCANMYPDTPEDPPQLIMARKQIDKLIGQWLQEVEMNNHFH
jgi:pimeloyl-ACP methyl ester carboxylesterase